MLDLEIISAKYEDPENKTISLVLKDNSDSKIFGGEEFPYGFVLDSGDQSEVSLWLKDLWDKGEIHPYDYDGPTREDLEADRVRCERNCRLSETDKYMTMDYPISDEKRQKIREYRQSLRDLTKHSGFPLQIEWPEKPEI